MTNQNESIMVDAKKLRWKFTLYLEQFCGYDMGASLIGEAEYAFDKALKELAEDKEQA